jgi:hypothetical protein
MPETRCLRWSRVCFSRFSCRRRRAVDFFKLAVLKCKGTLCESDEEWHIRAVANAFQHTDCAGVDLTVNAKIQCPFRANALADFHMRWFRRSVTATSAGNGDLRRRAR